MAEKDILQNLKKNFFKDLLCKIKAFILALVNLKKHDIMFAKRLCYRIIWMAFLTQGRRLRSVIQAFLRDVRFTPKDICLRDMGGRGIVFHLIKILI